MTSLRKIYITDELSGATANVNSDGELNVISNSVIDENNSTDIPLLSGEWFTGITTDVLNYSVIVVNVYSDQASANDGMIVEFSSDGTNWDNNDLYTINSDIGKFFTFPPAAKYFRIRYQNGIIDQTEFRLQTILKKTNIKPSSHRLEDNVVWSDDAELVKSVIAYEDINDRNFKNVSVQSPLPIDGDSIYFKDIWETESELNNFSGSVSDLFNNLHSVITDTTTNNPKELFIHFNRTVASNVVGLGTYTGNFSNTKIEIYNSGNVATTVIDESSSNTKYTTRTFQLPITIGFNAIKFSFETTDSITLSNVVVLKTRGVVARLQATKPDNTVTDINATTSGNLKISLEELESDVSVNGNTQLRTTNYLEDGTEGTKSMIINEAGNYIDSHVDADGGYHLGTSLIQSIISSTNNYTDTNLLSGDTYIGDADETFGINGIQVFHTADQDCRIYIDQSIDETFADSTQIITDSFDCLANIACSRTFISVAPYYRLRVENIGFDDTTKIISTTGMTPIINPLPRSLTEDGRLKVESTISGRENTERHIWVNPTNEMSISPVYRMVGTSFDGTTKDPNFWTETLVNGSITQSGGAITLQTSGAINSSAKYVSVRKARFVPGSAQLFTAGLGMTNAPIAGNTRRVGAYDINNGFFFQVAGTTFSIGTRKATVDTLISTGNFNGNYGPYWYPALNTFYKIQIEFTPLSTNWYINGKKLHSIMAPGLSNTLSLPITIENVNTTNNTDIDLICVGAYIARQGELKTNPTSYYHAYGSETGVNLKIGGGTVHTIIFGSAANNAVVTISDSTTGATPALWVYEATGALDVPVSVDMGGLPFNDGLRLTITSSASCTIVYE